MKNADIHQGIVKSQIQQIENKNINIKTEKLIIRNSINKKLFIEKLQGRYRSSYSILTDTEIADEINYIRNRYINQENINFNEKYIFYKLSKT